MIVTPVGVPLSLYKWLPDYARVALFKRDGGSISPCRWLFRDVIYKILRFVLFPLKMALLALQMAFVAMASVSGLVFRILGGVLLIFAAVGIAVGAISGETVWLFFVLAAVLLLFPWILRGLGELAGVILHAVQKV